MKKIKIYLYSTRRVEVFLDAARSAKKQKYLQAFPPADSILSYVEILLFQKSNVLRSIRIAGTISAAVFGASAAQG